MELKFDPTTKEAKKVLPGHTETYSMFKSSFPRPMSESMHVRHIMRYYIVRAMHQQGEEEVYLRPEVGVDGQEMDADVLAIKNGGYILALCEPDSVTPDTEQKLEVFREVENAEVIVVHSQYGEPGNVMERFESELEEKKFRILAVVPPPFDDVYEYDIWMFETTFRDIFSGE